MIPHRGRVRNATGREIRSPSRLIVPTRRFPSSAASTRPALARSPVFLY